MAFNKDRGIWSCVKSLRLAIEWGNGVVGVAKGLERRAQGTWEAWSSGLGGGAKGLDRRGYGDWEA